MKELFYSALSSGWLKPILIVAVMAGVYKISAIGRGKKRKHNFSLINEKLRGYGFGTWMLLDFVIYMGLAPALGFILFFILNSLSSIFIPENIIYKDNFSFGILALSSIFFGISAPAFLWVKITKFIHKERYKKNILYTMAYQGMDHLYLNKIVVQPLCILSLFFGLMGVHVIGVIKGGLIIERSLFSISSTVHSLDQVKDFLVTEKFVAPNGNLIDKVRLILKFNDGYIWKSIALGDDFTQEEMTTLAKHIYSISKIKPRVVEFSPYD